MGVENPKKLGVSTRFRPSCRSYCAPCEHGPRLACCQGPPQANVNNAPFTPGTCWAGHLWPALHILHALAEIGWGLGTLPSRQGNRQPCQHSQQHWCGLNPPQGRQHHTVCFTCPSSKLKVCTAYSTATTRISNSNWALRSMFCTTFLSMLLPTSSKAPGQWVKCLSKAHAHAAEARTHRGSVCQ